MRKTFFLLLLLSVGPVLGQKTLRDYDRSKDFSAYKTYAWQKDEPMAIVRADPDDEQISSEQADQLIRKQVEEMLSKKGLTKADRESADLLLSYFLVAQYDLGVEQYDPGASGWDRMDYGHWRPFYEPGQDNRLTRKGTLTLDFIDRKDKKLAWRGSATDTVKAARDTPRRIRKAISKLLKDFPPK